MKSLIAVGCAVTAVLLAACEKQGSGETAVPPERTEAAVEVRAMTFNVRYENPGDLDQRSWRERVSGAVRMIRREAPDLIGIQEALHGQAADLRASLPDYGFFGAGRDDGDRTGEYAGIFYRKNRFVADASDHGTFWLSDTPESPGSHTWGNEIPRVAAWVRLIDLATGRGIYFFNTHWDHRNQPSRERAAVLIAERMDRRKHMEDPVVLAGDFNSVETNPALMYLRGERGPVGSQGGSAWANGLLDSYQMLHPNEKSRRTLHFWNTNRGGNAKVDHILVSRGARVKSAAIVSSDLPAVSDHFPVTAEISFPP